MPVADSLKMNNGPAVLAESPCAWSRYISTELAANLMQLHPRRVIEMIERNELVAVSIRGTRGGNAGKAYRIDSLSLPLDAQIRYIGGYASEHPTDMRVITA